MSTFTGSPRPSSWRDFVSIGGVASLGASFIFFQLAGGHDARVQQLLQAVALDLLSGARQLDGTLPRLVAARGRIGCREPSKCELSDQPAVMRELLEEEVYFKEHTSGRVTHESFEVRREQEQREAFLEDVSGCIRLDNLQHAAGLPGVMEVKQVFRPVDLLQGTLLQAVINKAFKSMVKHGVRSTERYLPVNTTVTVIGELCRDTVGVPPASSTSTTSSGIAASRAPTSSGTAGSGGAGSRGPDGGGASSSGSKSINAAGISSRAGGAAAKAGSLGPGQGGGGGGGGDGATSTSAMTAAATAAAAAVGSELLTQAAAAGASAVAQALPYTLRMPSHGPFHVTTLTLPQLRASMERTSRTLRVFAWGFGVLGAALVVRKLLTQLWRLRQHRLGQRRMAEAEAVRRQRAAERAAVAAAGAGGGEALLAHAAAEEESGVRNPGTCVVCMDRDADVVFTGCGHLCSCYGCSTNLTKCPICRVNSRMLRVYRP
ncbi:hypothetical protein HYH02_009485 [Chlamydomonas schloesseri]|uniref:RING-type E3 ubiquitin transferase n=1 Tax=Chlamydomonas schloesseri TaxID=2026947 RepID=A0A835TFD1_9CHLO|nr:hypothetical protein HYH02_009485 [Chlamydomonas schloesseri]|eukprot:KAG2443071.1 hypothetical protein HYH02_009485 [Chlamydomonas schloesseri]